MNELNTSFTFDPTFEGNISLFYDWNQSAKTIDNGYNEYGVEIAIDAFDNIYHLGYMDFPGLKKIYLEKYNILGDFQWNQSWDGGLSALSIGGMCINVYNELFITGSYFYQDGTPQVNHNIFLIKYNQGGNFQWLKTWGLGDYSEIDDKGNDVIADSLGNVYVVGSSKSYTTSTDVVLLKYDRNGNLKWFKTWDGGDDRNDSGLAVEIDNFDNIYIMGEASTPDAQICVLKYDTSGTLLWDEIWGGYYTEKGKKIALDSFNNVYIIGEIYNWTAGNRFAYLVKFNSTGDEIWNITMDYSISTRFDNIAVDPFDNLYIIGWGYFFGPLHTFSLFKYNTLGGLLEYGFLEQYPSESDWIGLEVDSYGNVYTTGWYAFSDLGSFCLVKFLADSDRDGLLNIDEIDIFHTNPSKSDSDNDGLNDWDEIYGGIYLVYPDPTDPNDSDTDDDGLLDGEELLIYLTDPNNADTDLDGLMDGEEVNIYNTDPTNSDTDLDGLMDGEEVNIYNTNPTNSDTDSDTIPDKWEIDHFLDPLVNDTKYDPDNDTLTNLQEYQYNTHPFNNDTDSDGLIDGDEVNTYNTDPVQEDTDSDGLIDGEEVNTYNTDPVQEDTDSDGLLDGEEVNTYNTDPVQEDTDGDGWTDGDEVLVYDTDPLDPDDHPNPKTPPAIPGYNIFLFFGVISIASIILMKKQNQK